MVKKSKKASSVEDFVSETEERDGREEYFEDAETPTELEELKAQFSGNEYSVAVFRQSDDKTSWEKIKTYALDNFNADNIAEVYGGGKFKIKVLNGKGQYVKQYTITYAKPIVKENPVSVQSAENKNNEILDFLKTELSSRDLLLSKFIENANRPINIPQPNTPTIAEIIQLFTSLQSMINPANANQTKVSEIIDIMKLGMNFTKELSEKASENGNSSKSLEEIFTNKIIDALLPRVVGLLSGGFAPPKNVVSRQLTSDTPLKTNPPQTNVGAIPTVKNNEKKEELPMINYVSDFEKEFFEKLIKNKKQIIGMIKLGIEAEMSANYILQNFDEDQIYDYLKEYGVSRIVNLLPDYKPYESYLKNVENIILESLQEEIDESEDELMTSEEKPEINIEEKIETNIEEKSQSLNVS